MNKWIESYNSDAGWECTKWSGKYENTRSADQLESEDEPFDSFDVYTDNDQSGMINSNPVDRKLKVMTAAKLKLWENDDDWDEAYLKLKDSKTISFETGFNVCTDPTCFGTIL